MQNIWTGIGVGTSHQRKAEGNEDGLNAVKKTNELIRMMNDDNVCDLI